MYKHLEYFCYQDIEENLAGMYANTGITAKCSHSQTSDVL